MFRRLCACVEGRMIVPDDVAEWLSDGGARFESGAARTLCSALGMQRKTQAQIQERDKWLLLAAGETTSNRAQSRYWRAKRLSQAIREFEIRHRDGWDFGRRNTGNFDTTIEEFIYRAKDAVNWQPLPGKETLYKIILNADCGI